MGSATKTTDDPPTLLLSRPGPPVIAIGKRRAPDAEAAGNGIANSEDTLPDAYLILSYLNYLITWMYNFNMKSNQINIGTLVGRDKANTHWPLG